MSTTSVEIAQMAPLAVEDAGHGRWLIVVAGRGEAVAHVYGRAAGGEVVDPTAYAVGRLAAAAPTLAALAGEAVEGLSAERFDAWLGKAREAVAHACAPGWDYPMGPLAWKPCGLHIVPPRDEHDTRLLVSMPRVTLRRVGAMGALHAGGAAVPADTLAAYARLFGVADKLLDAVREAAAPLGLGAAAFDRWAARTRRLLSDAR